VKRAGWLVFGLLLTVAAGPTRPVISPSLPVPPIPPAHPPMDQTAPMPNANVSAPTAGSLLPNVTLQDFRANQSSDRSLGYVPGSQFETSEDKRPIQTPGLTWKVPLQ
jgi:hypothetical protein